MSTPIYDQLVAEHTGQEVQEGQDQGEEVTADGAG